MKIAVVTKTDALDSEVRKKILGALYDDGGFDIVECSANDIPKDSDRILVFGGDGTVLETVRKSAEYFLPVLGINMGNIGFLAEYEQDTDAGTVVAALKSERYVKRMLLSAEIGRNKTYALNEIVLKSVTTRPVHADLFIDGEYVDTYHSDGVIISSPTGSTAYSLSAGGPVLAPDVHAFVINPVCAHSLHSRPLVVSYKSEIKLKLSLEEEKAAVVADGECLASMSGSDELKIKKADTEVRFTAVNKNNFYKKLLTKMNRWGVTKH